MNILQFMQDNILYLDGGMGTLLQARGLRPGELPERWNLSHPEVIRHIHRSYYDSGSHVVNTNTFGAYCHKFEKEELSSIISAAVDNAKAARDTSSGSHPKYIALDLGPTGKLLKPYGDLDFEEAVSIFAETIRLGVQCGVDLIFIETMNDSYETKAALLAAKENSDLPVFVSNAYGEDGKLMTGASPSAMVAMLEGMHADAIGANCSLGPRQLSGVMDELLRSASVPVLLKPNAGLPRSDGQFTYYDVNPGEFAADIAVQIQKGVRIAGGCCGTTPEYIHALVENTKNLSPLPLSPKNRTWVSSYTHTVDFSHTPILIGERINPTGKKRFKQALKDNDINYILQEGIRQQEKGVHILDVNVGLPEIDEPSMLRRATEELQAILNLPLQIDTADVNAMEIALRRYNGKAMVNSVNGKAESMAAVFPLVQKYGGLVVALTLDEDGIPSTVEGRVSIARKIISTAARYGIDKKDLIFDPLAMTISADPAAALITLESLHRIRTELGCHTSLGVSNVSFGLPNRDMINSTFFGAALEQGLSAAIMNPFSWDMMKTYYAYRALHGLDENCAEYIAFCAALPETTTVAAPISVSSNAAGDSSLQRAIIKGLKDQASDLTVSLLTTGQPPLDIVQNDIIPALNIVGQGFEKKTMFLPQLLMSAEAAKGAFEKIKISLSTQNSDSTTSYPVILATVQGDIHDIGKNIVKLLLENYGFSVTDLGRDVAPETILETVQSKKAFLVGLSALMTTTVPAMEETIRLLRDNAPTCKIMVGGAVLTQEYAERMGADFYGRDAMEAVRFAQSLQKS